MFTEKSHRHFKNRQDAHYASVKPAILANGDIGAWLRIGGTFAVLSRDEFAAIADRVTEAFVAAEKDVT